MSLQIGLEFLANGSILVDLPIPLHSDDVTTISQLSCVLDAEVSEDRRRLFVKLGIGSTRVLSTAAVLQVCIKGLGLAQELTEFKSFTFDAAFLHELSTKLQWTETVPLPQLMTEQSLRNGMELLIVIGSYDYMIVAVSNIGELASKHLVSIQLVGGNQHGNMMKGITYQETPRFLGIDPGQPEGNPPSRFAISNDQGSRRSLMRWLLAHREYGELAHALLAEFPLDHMLAGIRYPSEANLPGRIVAKVW